VYIDEGTEATACAHSADTIRYTMMIMNYFEYFYHRTSVMAQLRSSCED